MNDFLITTPDYGRVTPAYGGALLVDEWSDGYFQLAIPLENVPVPFGDEEEFEYNILTERAKGKTKGKLELNTVSTDFLATKENCDRLDELKGKTLKYMGIRGNGMGYTYYGELSYRFNDSDNSDNDKGTLTITPSSIEQDNIYDVRPYIRQTLKYAEIVPMQIVLSDTTEHTYPCKLENSENATVVVEVIGASASNYTVEWKSTDKKLHITAKTGITTPSYAMIRLKASSTETMTGTENDTTLKYAPATLYVDLSYKKT